jgi:hypothetical protein
MASAGGVFQERQGCYDSRRFKLNPHGKGDTMFCNRSLTVLTAGAFAVAALSFPAYAAMAQNRAGLIVVAENKPDDKNKPKNNAPKAQPHVIQHPAGPPNGGQKNIQVQKNIHIQNNNQTQKNIQIQKNIGVQKNVNPKFVNPSGAPHIINPNNTGGPKTAHKVFTPHGKNSSIVIAPKIRSAPARGAFRTTIRGRNYSVWRGGYRARYHGGWRTFVALSALGAIVIGGAEYYPYAYIDAPQDYCDGLTEDGCQMVYDEVETEEGDVIPQCVAYCPWQ